MIAIAGAIGTGLFRAIRTVILRIGVFYAGSVLRLCLLLPYTADEAGVSGPLSRSSGRSALTVPMPSWISWCSPRRSRR